MKNLLEFLRTRVLIKASEWKSTSRIWNSMLLGKAAVIFALAFTLIELVRHAVNGLAITSLWIGHVGTHQAFAAKAWLMTDPSWLSMNQTIGNFLIDTANLFAGIGVSANELAISLMSVPVLSVVAGSAVIASTYVFLETYLFTSDAMYFIANGEQEEQENVVEEMRGDIQDLRNIIEANQEAISILMTRALAEEESKAEQVTEDTGQTGKNEVQELDTATQKSEITEGEDLDSKAEEKPEESVDSPAQPQEQEGIEKDLNGSEEGQVWASSGVSISFDKSELESLDDEEMENLQEAVKSEMDDEGLSDFADLDGEEFVPDIVEDEAEEEEVKPLSRVQAEEADKKAQVVPAEERNLSQESSNMLDMMTQDIQRQGNQSVDLDQKKEQQNTSGETL